MQDTGMRCHFLLQGIFPTQALNSHILYILFGGLSEDFKPKQQDSQIILKGCSEEERWGWGGQDILAFLQGIPGSQNETIYQDWN